MEGTIETENSQLRLLYQIYTDNIENAKRRQWSTVYYVLLSYAAIIGFYHLTRSEFHYTCWSQKALILIPALFVNVLGMGILVDIQKCLCQYRMHLRAIETTFIGRAEKILEMSSKQERPKISDYFWTLVFPFILLMTIGSLYVTCLLFYDKQTLTLIRIIWVILVINGIFFVSFYRFNSSKVEEHTARYDKVLHEIERSGRDK